MQHKRTLYLFFYNPLSIDLISTAIQGTAMSTHEAAQQIYFQAVAQQVSLVTPQKSKEQMSNDTATAAQAST